MQLEFGLKANLTLNIWLVWWWLPKHNKSYIGYIPNQLGTKHTSEA